MKYLIVAFFLQFPLLILLVGLVELTGSEVFWSIFLHAYVLPADFIIRSFFATNPDRDVSSLMATIIMVSIYGLLVASFLTVIRKLSREYTET